MPAASSSPLTTSRTAPGSVNTLGSHDQLWITWIRSPAPFVEVETVWEAVERDHAGAPAPTSTAQVISAAARTWSGTVPT